MKLRNKKKTDTIKEYQRDIDELQESVIPGKIRWILILIITFICAAIIWAIVGRVDRVVVASGKLITTSPNILIQPLRTSVIKDIYVQVGDVVKKDQILAILDPTFAEADFAQIQTKTTSIKAQLRRIDAELMAEEFLNTSDEGEDGIIQYGLFLQRLKVYEMKKQLLIETTATLESKLERVEAQISGGEKELKALREIEGINAKFSQTNKENQLKVLASQKERYQAATIISALRAEKNIYKDELKQVVSEFDLWVEERNRKLLEDKVLLRTEYIKLQEEMSKATRMSELVNLKAPSESIVLEIAERFIGSVIREAEPLITLVPTNVPIELEVEVQAKDIGKIRINDPCRIKLDAFPFQKHGILEGRVRIISEDAFQTKPSQGEGYSTYYYKSRIKLTTTTLRDVPKNFRLIPGMKVKAEIKIGKRSVISYFLYPILRVLDESIREP